MALKLPSYLNTVLNPILNKKHNTNTKYYDDFLQISWYIHMLKKTQKELAKFYHLYANFLSYVYPKFLDTLYNNNYGFRNYNNMGKF